MTRGAAPCSVSALLAETGGNLWSDFEDDAIVGAAAPFGCAKQVAVLVGEQTANRGATVGSAEGVEHSFVEACAQRRDFRDHAVTVSLVAGVVLIATLLRYPVEIASEIEQRRNRLGPIGSVEA